MSPLCLGSQGCHLIPLYYLLSCFCFSAQPGYFFCLIFFPACWPILLILFHKIQQYFLLRDRLFCTAPVQQLGEVSWSVVCAACCHMAPVFAVMHLYNSKKMFIASVHSFFLYTFFKNLVLINQRNGPLYQHVLVVCAFSTGVIPKGLILRKFCV